MKLEKLERNKKKKIVIGVVAFLCFISAIMFMGSRAKYKVTQSIPLVNGTINYEIGDFNVVAMYTSDDGTNYTEVDKMPESGYTINEEKSYCKVNGEKDDNAKLYTNAKGEHVISNLQKNSKCYVWFDKLTTKKVDTVLGKIDVNIECSDTFSKTSTTDEGICETEDDLGTSYYYRGAVTNNWVQFAGFYWRIIRINGDGSIRMIYNGTSTTTTGIGTQLQKSVYNSNKYDNAFVGYMYGIAGSTTYEATHANTNNSTIKEIIDSWYKTNIADKGYGNKVSRDAGFCNDRSIASSSETWWSVDTRKGYGTNSTAYGPFSRLLKSDSSYNTIQTPQFICANKTTDLFTAKESTKGNEKLTYPVGLITSDEVVFAGGFGGSNNSNYYLYTNQEYWTMSPYTLYTHELEGSFAYMFTVRAAGNLGSNVVRNEVGIRPVINLSSDIQLMGSGTASDPYKVV